MKPAKLNSGEYRLGIKTLSFGQLNALKKEIETELKIRIECRD